MSDKVDSPRKPRDDEIDIYGLTHRGKVRRENEDHFLVCQLHRRIEVSFTSLPDTEIMPAGSERIATVAMVADGVGGGKGGEHRPAGFWWWRMTGRHGNCSAAIWKKKDG